MKEHPSPGVLRTLREPPSPTYCGAAKELQMKLMFTYLLPKSTKQQPDCNHASLPLAPECYRGMHRMSELMATICVSFQLSHDTTHTEPQTP